ncbi:MAG TPA: S8 family peptidase [Pyrinomonadaceae bacterium]|nr:S8 family peptidase [Pyrinomonadaceae bacterium]
MGVLDFQLKQQLRADFPQNRIHVLLKVNDGFAGEEMDFSETSRAGSIVAGSVPLEQLEKLARCPGVDLIECSRHLKDELDDSIVEANLVNANDVRQIQSQGAGAIIGVIDSGFELTHPRFRDANNKTRIIAAWDQSGGPTPEPPQPGWVPYGVEYSSDDIDARTIAETTLIIRNHPHAGAHGTAVAGIAAGSPTPLGLYPGMAPEAQLVLVSYRNDVQIGSSAFVMDAIKYILDIAKRENKPVVINISQGDNLGAHDGTSLLELGIENFLAQERLLIVNSAGNGRGSARHTEGQVNASGFVDVPFTITASQASLVDGETIDLWYDGRDRFSVALRMPDGTQTKFVEPESEEELYFPDGTSAYVYSDLDYPTNHDNRISIILEKGTWADGSWAVILRGDRVTDGKFHAWADRPNATTVITFDNPTDNCTVTLPGTTPGIISVTSFVSRPSRIPGGETRGTLAPHTSIGPTRNNKLKPNIAAPGAVIMAPALTSVGRADHVPQIGTSMAAPHVTGIIALLWSLDPTLSPHAIRSQLYATARRDRFTGTTPSVQWGNGKLDAAAVYKSLFNAEENNQRNGESDMPRQVHNLQLNVPTDSGTIPVNLQIVIDNGDVVSMSGTSGSRQVEATLNLRLVSRGEGGDQCIVCNASGCREVTPCPGSNPNGVVNPEVVLNSSR